MTMQTCTCREYREQISPNADHHGICYCTHTRDYHKRNVGPCWCPTNLKAGK